MKQVASLLRLVTVEGQTLESTPAMNLPARHFDAIDSTMEAAKRWVHEQAPQGLAYVTASTQMAGRGTQGRTWQSPPGNLYMTCLVSLKALSRERLGTLPLEAGLVLYRLLHRLLALGHLPDHHPSPLWLKWPNDLLLQQNKVAGMLIEVHQGHMLLGLGLNLAAEPEIRDGGRPAGGLAELSPAFQTANRLALAAHFAADLNACLSLPWGPALLAETLQAWSQATRWSEPLILRRQFKRETSSDTGATVAAGQPEGASSASSQLPRTVMPLRLTEKGHLEVRHADGKIETLVADYLW